MAKIEAINKLFYEPLQVGGFTAINSNKPRESPSCGGMYGREVTVLIRGMAKRVWAWKTIKTIGCCRPSLEGMVCRFSVSFTSPAGGALSAVPARVL